MNFLKQIVTIVSFALCVQLTHAQNWFFNKADSSDQHAFSKNAFIQIRYQRGRFTQSGDSGVQYIEKNPFNEIEVRYGFTGYGRKKWHQLHHYPTYGFGISQFFFQPNSNIYGNPFAAYLFFNEPILQFRKSKLAYDFDVGISSGWKPYDPQSNPDQGAIGSSVNFIFMLGLQYEFKISNRFDGIIGANLNHMSNGRIRSPNLGVNQYAANVSLRYRLAPSKKKKFKAEFASLTPANIHHDIDTFRSMLEFYTVGSAGVATNFKDKNDHIYYLTASVTADVARHYQYNAKFGVGIDLFYDESLKGDYQPQYPSGNVPSGLLYWPGIHLSHEYMVHRWTLITQAGLNLVVPKDKGIWFGRIGLRYDVSKAIFLRASIRLYSKFHSDFVEWGLGYSFYKLKK